MTLLVRHPPNNLAERSYIYHVILGEFLGLDWKGIVEERSDVCIELQGIHRSRRRLVIADDFLLLAPKLWLHPDSLPREPLKSWTPRVLHPTSEHCDSIPVLYGEPSCSFEPDQIHLAIDIFGSCFFLLSRYEEAVRMDRDHHGRFPSVASIASRGGFLDRPLANEYVEILWASLLFLWPQLVRAQRESRTFVTCDVDRPLTTWARNTGATLRKILNESIRHRNLQAAKRALRLHLAHRASRFEEDPFFTFDWMLDACERAGHAATFNFLCACTDQRFDGSYALDEPFIRRLLQTIHVRGHQIGLHGSYNSYINPTQLEHEANILRSALAAEGIHQGELGARQHYLRWKTPDTARILDQADISFDSTLGFADQVGFRCGTCYEYPLYDLERRRQLQLRERPLIVMDQSVLSPQYLGIREKAVAMSLMHDLKKKCQRFHGDFVLLWHNSSLTTDNDRELFLGLLSP